MIHTNYELRLAKFQEVDDIKNVVNEAYDAKFGKYILDTAEHPRERTNSNKIISMLNDASVELYVLIDKTTKTVSGTICYLPNKHKQSGYFGMFSLNTEARLNKLGSEMIHFIESRALSQGKKAVKLDVSGFATPLHTYYQSQGYAPTGKKLDWADNIHWKLKPQFDGASESQFIVMKKDLISHSNAA